MRAKALSNTHTHTHTPPPLWSSSRPLSWVSVGWSESTNIYYFLSHDIQHILSLLLYMALYFTISSHQIPKLPPFLSPFPFPLSLPPPPFLSLPLLGSTAPPILSLVHAALSPSFDAQEGEGERHLPSTLLSLL